MYGVNITNYYGHIFESPINVIMKEVRIDELFELVKVKGHDTKDLKDGPYPLIMSTSVQNGIGRYVDKYSLDGDYITIPSTGSVGYCFVQRGKFAMLNSNAHPPTVIKLKSSHQYLNSCLGCFAFIMTQKFTKLYSYSTKLNNSRLMNETIELPVVVRGVSESEMKQLIDGMITIDELTNDDTKCLNCVNGTNDKYTYEINENLLNNYIYTCLM